MKLLISLTLIIIATLVFGYYVQTQILTISSQLQEQIPELSRQINAESWSQAQNKVEKMIKKWNEVQDYWDLFINHNTIDQVELSLVRILSYLSSEDKSSALAEVASLSAQLSSIYRREMFNLQNVL